MARQTKRGRGQCADRRAVGAANKHRRAGVNRAGLFKAREQAEPLEHRLAVAADEFAANPVARIAAGLENFDRHVALPQTDAQRQTRQSAADDRDGFGPAAFFNPFAAR